MCNASKSCSRPAWIGALLLVLGLAAPAAAVDVELSAEGAPSGTPSCAGVAAGVAPCAINTGVDSEVVVTWSLDSQQALAGYDLEVAWDPGELTLVDCEALYPDTQPPGSVPFLLSPCDVLDPGGSSAVALSLLAFPTTTLFRLTFQLDAVSSCDASTGADLYWTPNGGGLSPAGVVLTNPAGAGLDVCVATPQCSDGVDNDFDGNTDYPADTGCGSANDPSERLDCEDGLDNDADGFVDFPNDPGCFSATFGGENSACQNGLDDDGDAGIDFDGGVSANHGVALGPPDVNCNRPYQTAEAVQSGCGLGFELVALLPLMAWRSRQRRR